MFRIVTLIILVFCSLAVSGQKTWEHKIDIKPGDILFQDADCGDFCLAITKVTSGFEGARLSHVGIVDFFENQWMVIEATGKGVVATPLETFLNQSIDKDGNPKVISGRVINQFQPLIGTALEYCRNQIGKPYDWAFEFNNDSYYCSELIYFAFKEAMGGKEFFKSAPMTFIDPDSGLVFSVWEDYFKELKIPVPEGNAGCNPGGLSKSPMIQIVHVFGNPDGLNE